MESKFVKNPSYKNINNNSLYSSNIKLIEYKENKIRRENIGENIGENMGGNMGGNMGENIGENMDMDMDLDQDNRNNNFFDIIIQKFHNFFI